MPKPCKVPDCEAPKVSVQGARFCRAHSPVSHHSKRPSSLCRVLGCDELKDYTQDARYCSRHVGHPYPDPDPKPCQEPGCEELKVSVQGARYCSRHAEMGRTPEVLRERLDHANTMNRARNKARRAALPCSVPVCKEPRAQGPRVRLLVCQTHRDERLAAKAPKPCTWAGCDAPKDKDSRDFCLKHQEGIKTRGNRRARNKARAARPFRPCQWPACAAAPDQAAPHLYYCAEHEAQAQEWKAHAPVSTRGRATTSKDRASRKALLIVRLCERDGVPGCLACGEDDPEMLLFHHVDPSSKTKGVAASLDKGSRARAEAETAKCVVLCHNHHVKWHKIHGNNHGDGMGPELYRWAALTRTEWE